MVPTLSEDTVGTRSRVRAVVRPPERECGSGIRHNKIGLIEIDVSRRDVYGASDRSRLTVGSLPDLWSSQRRIDGHGELDGEGPFRRTRVRAGFAKPRSCLNLPAVAVIASKQPGRSCITGTGYPRPGVDSTRRLVRQV